MRILLFSGNGGVGKTSLAAATGLKLAERGHRTLVLSVDPAHSLADAFDLGIELFDRRTADPVVLSDPEFDSQWALMTNIQLERALTTDFSASVGYVNSIMRNMPMLVNVNLIPTGATLADGRPIYSTEVNAQTRVNPTFNAIDMFQSVGEGSYNAFTVSLNKRMSMGVQFQASYTYAKGTDNAPLTGTYVVGSQDDRIRSFEHRP